MIEETLAGLATTAPETVEPQVLLATGHADGYVAQRGPTGNMFVAFNPRGISLVDLGDDAAAFEAYFVELFDRPVFLVTGLPPRLAGALKKALATNRLGSLAIDWSGMSEFQKTVLRKAAQILPGEVRPYSWIAKEIGNPGAVRAVGTALARNPVPVVVPCHRVVRNDGQLGNYFYGTKVKRAILEAEGLNVAALESLATRGIKLTGSDTTNIFCNPTCRDARRTTPKHTVEFRDEAQARAAGYRPCKHCRPEVAA
jgi:O-6-methylguanine DNA methyltransferase